MTDYAFPTEVIDRLRQAERIVVLTGAGMSAESGIPTFRDAQTGLWAQYDPQQLATPEAFRRDPGLVWDWYQWRRELVAGATPNSGHYALAELERRAPHFTLITQNIDGLHAIAASKDIIELHGNIWWVKCVENQHRFDAWNEGGEHPPRCPVCGSLLRPDVVWFGEGLPAEALRRAQEASLAADVFMTIGTSGLVHPAAMLPLFAADAGAFTIEINPVPTELSDYMTCEIRGPSGIVLPQLVSAVWGAGTDD